MIDYRAIYSKTGDMKYISHLDTSRMMQRALKRTKLPIWYSEGFNPRIYITFAIPLSLGFESIYEIMDFRLNEEIEIEKVKDVFNATLPDGFNIIEILKPIKKAKSISSNDYEIKIESNNENFLSNFNSFSKQDEIHTIKKTKKGEKEIDLKKFFKIKNFEKQGNEFILTINFKAGSVDNTNPNLLFTAFENSELKIDFFIKNIKKIYVFDEKDEIFR